MAFFKSAQYLPYLTALFTLCLFAVLWHQKKIIFIPLIIAGALYAAWYYGAWHQPPAFSGKKSIEAVITGYASPAVKTRYDFSQSFRVTKLFLPKTEDPKEVPSLKKVRIYTQIPLSTERLYRLQTRLTVQSPRLDPGYSNFASIPRAEVQGIASCGSAPLPERLRGGLDRYYRENFPAQEAGFLMSITTGERSMLDWQTRRSFSHCGLAHLISIAGMHFGIFSLSIFFLVRVLLRFFVPLKWLERVTLHISPNQIAALASFPLLSGYLLLSGMRVPAMRAFIMISFFLFGILIGRKRAWQTTLAFAAFLLVLWQPYVIFELSFQLSFLSVLLIGLFASGQKEESKAMGGEAEVSVFSFRFIKKYIVRILVMSLWVTAGLMPLIAFYFHRVQLISPAANLAVVPVAGFLLIPVAVLSGFMYLVSGWYPLPFLSGLLASVSIRLAGFFSSLPYVCPRVAAFPAGFLLVFYGFLAAWLYSKKRGYIALAVLPFAVWTGLHLFNGIYPFKGRGLDITFLDDGAGESAVAELPDGKTAVIDTGVNGRETSACLQYMGKNRIDYLVLSHAHHDHTGGAAFLASHYRVGEIWDNGMLILDKGAFDGIPEEKLSRGEYIEGREGAGSYRITVLHPYAAFFPLRGPLSRAVNNSSLVIKIEDRWGKSVLFDGDIERGAQEDLLRLGALLHCDIYKVPHHGSDSASWRPFINAVHPAFAVISPGDGNHFGFPRPKTLRALSDCGASVLRTDTDGAVKAEFDENGIHIKTWKNMELMENPADFPEELHNLRVLFSSW